MLRSLVGSEMCIRDRWNDNPLSFGGGIENPLVIRTSSGVYLMIFADNKDGPQLGFGFGWSLDGVVWEKNTGRGSDSGLCDQVIAAAPEPYSSVRTPLALLEHDPGRFTLYFTAFVSQHNSTDFRHPPSVPHEQWEALYASEFELVLTRE
eukprot:TRINITY_DN4827_c0_g4_i2.p1 TRINITY_DN4827_c0_g4~~TRINITY_DN4827_c0_g4_i2.p1  ORF type:complete len:165 (+),score=52.79 TRINITY_DN4827_c0_g4_i2:46-495(+)